MRRLIPVALVLLALALRIAWPLADPPERLSWSTAIYTDPASKTLPARYAAEFGDWNLAEGQYLRAFPLANGLTFLAYRAFGVSRHTHQMLAALVSTIALLGLLWSVRRDETALLFAAILGATSWWLTMFGRVPVVENFVAALGAFALGLTLRGGTFGLAAAGVLAATAAFFGKYHAIALLPALAIFVRVRERSARPWLPLAGGAGVVTVVWLGTIFLPHRAEILQYVHRVSTGIHGALPITRSPATGVLEIFRSVQAAWLFHHAPVVGGLGLYFALRTLTDRERFRARVSAGSALFALTFVSGWLYYAFLSYKAPRYYVVLGGPLVACAAFQLAEWWSMDRFSRKPKGRRGRMTDGVVAFALAVVGLDIARHALSGLALVQRTAAIDAPSRLVGAIEPVTAFLEGRGPLALAALVGAFAFAAPWPRRAALPAPRRLAALLVAASLLLDVGRYAHWALHRKYVITQIQQAIPTVVASKAVIVGPFAAILTQDSGLAAISWIDPLDDDDALARLRPTHRLEDERSNALGFDESLPMSIASATPLVTWPFRTPNVRSITLSRGGGAEATTFERCVDAMQRNAWQEALRFLDEHEASFGPTPDALFKRATCAFETGDAPRAGALLRRALELRPDSPLYWFNLGMVSEAGGDRRAAREAWGRALELDPYDTEPLSLLRATR